MYSTNNRKPMMSIREAIRILLLSPLYLQFDTVARKSMVEDLRRTCW